mmetsp:Transcript_19360/g.28566  ORF Transcript_19360/g.28566 Transcript_19360/m.28566 type:complete len:89 (+) Transcript_19360:1913-2179(+)
MAGIVWVGAKANADSNVSIKSTQMDNNSISMGVDITVRILLIFFFYKTVSCSHKWFSATDPQLLNFIFPSVFKGFVDHNYDESSYKLQ